MRGTRLNGVLYNQRRGGWFDLVAGIFLVLFIGGAWYQAMTDMHEPADRTAESSDMKESLTPMDEYVREHDPASKEAVELSDPATTSGT